MDSAFHDFAFSPLLDEGLVVPWILADLPGFDFDDPGDHAIEQPSIMADQHHRALELFCEEGFEPSSPEDVEVIRRFVEEQKVGRFQEEPRQTQPCLLSSGEGVDGLVKSIIFKTQAVERCVDAVIDGIPSELFETGIEFGLFFHQTLESVAFGGSHVFVDFFKLRLCGMEAIEGATGSLPERVARNEFWMLGQMPDPDTACQLH